MKKLILGLLLISVSLANQAQNYIHFYESGSATSFQLYEDDSIYFDASHVTMYFDNAGSITTFNTASIDSITFTKDQSKNVYIEYQGSSVNITNPMSSSGVVITTNGADVLIESVSTEKDINYILSGTTTDGFFKIYSDKRFNVLMDNVSITNPNGPAVNIQSDKDATIHLINGTINTISDGAIYDTAPTVGGEQEDQKAAFFSEADLEILGGGTLDITGLGTDQHALASDDDIKIYQGVINILSSQRDGIHAKEKIKLKGGNLTINSFLDDGMDCGEVFEINCGSIEVDVTVTAGKGLVSDSVLIINGGNINIVGNADQTDLIKGEYELIINGGEVEASSIGDVVLVSSGSGYDPDYCSLLSSDSILVINGGILNLTTSGEAGRAITADNNIEINGGEINIVSAGNGDTYTNELGEDDAYHSTSIKAKMDLLINGGNITISNSGTGGKGIDCDGSITIGDGSTTPELSITTTGSSIIVSAGTGGGGGPGGGPGGGTSADTDEAKTIKSDIDIIINSGVISINSADDGIKAGQSITFHNGTLDVSNSVEGLEAPDITVNNGTITVNATDDGFNATQGEEVMTDDGSQLTINGGNITVNMSGNDVDAMDSNGDITINAGTIYLNFPTSGPSEGLDANGTITIEPGASVYENGVLIP